VAPARDVGYARAMNAALLGLAAPLALLPLAPAQSEANFATPVRLSAGGQLLGAHRLFPSPVLHDVNGDGLRDVVVGDLWGKLTVALRLSAADPRAFGEESELTAADGKPIDFHNW
jgi:hypothetical protein